VLTTRHRKNLNLLRTGDKSIEFGSGCGQVTGCCEFGNEPSGSIKYGEFRDLLVSFSGRTLLYAVSK
jgi:hypothetical protein